MVVDTPITREMLYNTQVVLEAAYSEFVASGPGRRSLVSSPLLSISCLFPNWESRLTFFPFHFLSGPVGSHELGGIRKSNLIIK